VFEGRGCLFKENGELEFEGEFLNGHKIQQIIIKKLQQFSGVEFPDYSCCCCFFDFNTNNKTIFDCGHSICNNCYAQLNPIKCIICQKPIAIVYTSPQ